MRYVVLIESEDYNVILGICESFGEAMEKMFKYLEEHFAYGLELNETGCMVIYTLHGDHVCESGITESIYILESEEEKEDD